jgi:hypothetical protein
LLDFNKGAPHLSLLTVERNQLKIWRILNEGATTLLEEAYCLAMHKNIVSAVHHQNQIVICLEQGLSITIDEKFDYVSKVDLEIKDVCFVCEWGKNIVLFTKSGLMYLMEHQKQKKVLDVDLREKVDFFSLEQYGSITNNLQNKDFEVEYSMAHCKLFVYF